MKLPRIAFALIFCLFLVGFVSAELQFDNVVKYEEPNNLKLDIKNTFGLGETLGTLELKSHRLVNGEIEIKELWGNKVYVPTMVYELSGWELYENGLGNVYFTDEKTGKSIDKPYYFAIWTEVVKNSTIRGEGTSETPEGEIIGYEDRVSWEWVEYDSRDIPDTKTKTIKIALMVYVEKGDYTDAVWTLAGKRIKEHAAWVITDGVNVGNLTGQGTNFIGMSMKADGTRLYETASGGTISAWNCSTAYDVTSCTTAAETLTGVTAPRDMYFRPDGTKVYFITSTGDLITQYDCATAWNIQSCSSVNTNSTVPAGGPGLGDATPEGVTWSSNGLNLYSVGRASGGDIYHSTCSTAWDLASCTFSSQSATQTGTPEGMYWRTDGSEFWVINLDDDMLKKYTCTVNFDLSTCSYASIQIYSMMTTPFSVFFTDEGNNFYIGGATPSVFQWEMASAAPTDTVPNITVNTPGVWDNLTSTFSQTFNITVEDDNINQNVSLMINGTIVETNSTTTTGSQFYYFTYIFPSNSYYNWSAITFDNASQTNTTDDRYITVEVQSPTVNLYAPIPYYNTSNYNVTHTCDVVSYPGAVVNISLLVNGIYNQTNTAGTNNTNYTFYNGYADGNYNWSCISYNNLNLANSYVNRSFTVESASPVLNLTFPRGKINYHRLGQNLFLNWTLEEPNFLNCSYNYNENLIYLNETWCKETNYTNFNYSKGIDSIIMYANDTFFNNVTNTSAFEILVLEESFIYSATSLKGSSQDYHVNFTSNGSVPTNGKFFYDGSLIGAATITNFGSDLYGLNYTQIVNSAGTFNLFFSVDVGGTNAINTTTRSQLVSPINFSLCDAGNPVGFINFTFQDESTGSAINAKADLIDVDYWLDDPSNAESYITTKTASNASYYSFCFNPGTSNVTLNMSFKYSESDYPIRTFAFKEQTFTSSTTNRTLYMLQTADGIYTTIQVIDTIGSPLSGTQVTMERKINGVWVVVGLEVAGDDGGATFWVNPNFQHRITAVKGGYITQQVTITPSQTAYTITLALLSSDLTDYSQGVSYYMNPSKDFLDNFTEYDFNMTIASSFWTIGGFGFSLYWDNGTLIGSDSKTVVGTTEITGVNNTGNQTSIYMNWYYLIDTTYVNGTRTWLIQSTGLRDFSLFSFFTTLSLYMNSDNLFGFDGFGRILLSIIIIVMVTGSITIRYGVQNDIFVAGVIFGLVLFLDYGLDFFGRIQIGPNFAVQNFVTIMVALILVAMIIMEERR